MNLFHNLLLFSLFFLFANSQYNPQIALELAHYSDIAYEDPTKIQTWTCQRCSKYQVQHVNIFKNDDLKLQGITLYSKKLKAIVVIFRGTLITALQNVFVDISLLHVNYPKCYQCKVHMGFYDSHNKIKFDFLAQLTNILKIYPNAKIYSTGHSLGGALATLAVPEIIQKFGRDKFERVYTFGEPRVGNKNFATYFNTLTTQYRVIHKKDIVPQVPFKSPFLQHKGSLNHQQLLSLEDSHGQSIPFGDYYHQGVEIWYKDDFSRYLQCKSEDQKCYNSIWVVSLSIPDHMISNYLQISPRSTKSNHNSNQKNHQLTSSHN